jgi:tRNA threonylcarbamoyl adenosine modification protein YeaZ
MIKKARLNKISFGSVSSRRQSKGLILFIDTTGFEQARVMLLGQNFNLAVDFNVQQNWSEQIFVCLKRLLAKAKARFSDIGRIWVVPGPGSFSGTRTGVAVANALAFALNVPVAAVTKEACNLALEKLNKLTPTTRSYIIPIYSQPAHITRPRSHLG